jgi:hypothetical protein
LAGALAAAGAFFAVVRLAGARLAVLELLLVAFAI